MIENIVGVMTGSGISTLLIFLLARKWIESRITHSIEHEYKKQLERFSRKIELNIKNNLNYFRGS